MELHLTYFGDNNFSLGKNRIRKQAENFRVFKSIQEFGESDLEDNLFWEQYAKPMMAKFDNAIKNNESVTLWGDGSSRREFLHVDDLAEACYTCMQKYDEAEHINVGTGEDVRIWELANIISEVVGFPGEIAWDFTKPNGTPRKVLNVDKIKSLGWEPKISLREGIEKTYEWFKSTI
jgi:nucleoside-diphosphate-sugar epimerase